MAQRLDGSGNVLSTDLYDAFGTRLAGGAAGDPWGFEAQAGYYTDTETGLLLLTHRYYDPNTGRFLTRDPMGYDGGINLYGYVGNNPVNEMDPDGTQAVLTAAQQAYLLVAAAIAAAAEWARNHPIGPIYWHPPWSNPTPPIIATPIGPTGPFSASGPPESWPAVPENIPGGPWTWNPNKTNDRGGAYRGPVAKGPPGSVSGKPELTWSPERNGDGGYWKCNRPGKVRDKYYPNGDPLPEGHQGHPTR